LRDQNARMAPAYTIGEIASRTGFSRQTITRLSECVPGVLVVSRPETIRKRRHRSIRIPESVLERVLRGLEAREKA